MTVVFVLAMTAPTFAGKIIYVDDNASIVAWGYNDYGECNIMLIVFIDIPRVIRKGLRRSGYISIAKADGLHPRRTIRLANALSGRTQWYLEF